jgi:uncharacterized membrane protein
MNMPHQNSIKWKELLIIGMVLFPIVLTVYIWPFAPDIVPIHWDFAGNPDNYADKAMGLLLFPGIIIGLYFFLKYLPKIDPSKFNYPSFEKVLLTIRLALHSLLLFIHVATTLSIIGSPYNITSYIFYALIIFMIVLGNSMIDIEQNYFIGIRTPWTLSNKEVWTSTHKFGGYLWVISGILILCLLLLLELLHINSDIIFTLFLMWIGLIVIAPITYSFVYFKKIEKAQKS